MQTHLSFDEAVKVIRSQKTSPGFELISLDEALGRVLAIDVYACRNIPSFKKSPFDGYALRSMDCPGTLKYAGTVYAGIEELKDIQEGECVKIFTGAPLPPSADVVIKSEDALFEEGILTVLKKAPPLTNVIMPGEDIEEGQLLIRIGTRLNASHLGVLAGQGLDRVMVYSKPRACIIPTGSELAEPGEECSPFGIYNSSSYVLSAYLREMGFDVDRTDIVPDEAEEVKAAVERVLSLGYDAVFTTGGASIGDKDYALETAKSLGADILFWKVSVKPGGALLVSKAEGKALISLSGNPAAAIMSILVVLRAWLFAMTGREDPAKELELPLKDDMPKSAHAVRLLRGRLFLEDGKAYFSENQGRGNGNIASFDNCDLIGIIPGGTGPLKKGDVIKVLSLSREII